MRGGVLVCSVFLSACPEGTAPMHPRVTLASSGHVAVGTQLKLETSWSGNCDYRRSDQLFAQQRSSSSTSQTFRCDSGDYGVAIDCEHACVWRRTADHKYEVTPTKLGTLNLSVVLDPGRANAKTLVIPPVTVHVPTRAEAACHIWRDGSPQVNVALLDGGIALQHGATVKVRGGAACIAQHSREPGLGDYTCPQLTAGELEISTGTTTLAATVACRTVLPTPKARPETRAQFLLGRDAYPTRDDVLRATRAQLVAFGWSEVAAVTSNQATQLTVSKPGVAIEITVADEGDGYRWSYSVVDGSVIGSHEIAGATGF